MEPNNSTSPAVGVLVRIGRALRSTRGATLIVVAAGSLLIFGMSGLALDSARGYLHRLHLARAVDAAALMGARNLRSGESEAVNQALAAATANGVTTGQGGAVVTTSVSTNAEGETTFGVIARQPIATTLMRLFGFEQIEVAAAAVAAVPPVDLVLVLDQSGSLEQQNAWDDLQRASRTFVRYFADAFDQLGLVSFQIRATDREDLDHDFTSPIVSEINDMESAGDTNTGEGLRLGLQQMQSEAVRDRSARVVVFFTDGRPTAFRGIVNGRDRVMAVYTTRAGGRMRGYFNNPDALPTDEVADADGCRNAYSCWGWTEASIRNQARQNGIVMADAIRATGTYVYTIGLGNPGAGDPLLVPDMSYLRLLANENGMANSSQPMGQAYFAPSPAQLEDVFEQVAQDLLVRLAQ